MLIPIRRDRTSKPPIGTPLRTDGHWSVQNLEVVWGFNEGGGFTTFASDGTPSTLFNNNAVAWKADTFGTTANTTSIKLLQPEHPALSKIATGKPMTFLLSFDLPSVASSNTGLLSTTNWDGATFLLEQYWNGSFYKLTTYCGGTTSTAQNKVLGRRYRFVCTADSTRASSYMDGVLESTTTNINQRTTVGGLTLGSGSINLSAANPINAEILTFHSRALTAYEVKLLSDNPWQIYEPEVVWIDTETGGEAAAFNASLSAAASTFANLSTIIRLASGINGSASSVANLFAGVGLLADIVNTSAVGANLSTAIRLAGGIAASSVSTAQLITNIRLQTGINPTAATVAALATSIRLASQIAGQATTSAGLFTSTLSQLDASIVASGATTASLNTAIRMAAALVGGSTTAANVETVLTLAASVANNSYTTANLETAIKLYATPAGRATFTAALTAAMVHSLCMSISAQSAKICMTGHVASIEVTHAHC